VKICGVTRREDALVADGAGADYLGVILSRGFGRSVAPAAAGPLFDGVRAKKVAVMVDEPAEAAALAARALGADVVQLHGNETPDALDDLRGCGPWKLWKAVRARSIDEVEAAVARFGPVADGVLLEGWKEGSVGGSGARVTLDPGRVRDLIPASLTFVLAGGLTPDNVLDAVSAFRPDIVDVSSGVERALGVKDQRRVRGFIEAAHDGAAVASPHGAHRSK
jgi:phosphoribosylanthranilate isomerase